jgi:hypothetical protein
MRETQMKAQINQKLDEAGERERFVLLETFSVYSYY